MPVKAKLRFARIQPSKVRLAADLVRGRSLADAETVLSLMPNRAARLLGDVIRSAAANAENNHELDREDLFIESVTADAGPTYGRLKPRARGRADVVRRQLCHISVVLEERGGERSES